MDHTHLTREQKYITDYPEAGLLFIEGNVGSGKTTAIIDRAKKISLHENYKLLFLTFTKNQEIISKNILQKNHPIKIDNVEVKTLYAFCLNIIRQQLKFPPTIVSGEKFRELLKEILLKNFGNKAVHYKSFKVSDFLRQAYFGNYPPISTQIDISQSEVNKLLVAISQIGILSLEFLPAVASWFVNRGSKIEYTHVFIDNIEDFTCEGIELCFEICKLSKIGATIIFQTPLSEKLNSSNILKYKKKNSKIIRLSSVFKKNIFEYKLSNAYPYDGLDSLPSLLQIITNDLEGNPHKKLSIALISLPTNPLPEYKKIQKAVDDWFDDNISTIDERHLDISAYSIQSLKGLQFDYTIVILDRFDSADMNLLSAHFSISTTRSTEDKIIIAVTPSVKKEWLKFIKSL